MKRTTKLLLILAVLLLTWLTTATALADNVNYYDPTASVEQMKTAANATQITSGSTALGTPGNTTWYYVSGATTVDTRIEVRGTVNIILTDGCSFTASKGIHVVRLDYRGTNALNIYAQKAGDGCGALTAQAPSVNAAIGGNVGDANVDWNTGAPGEDAGDITIYGGRITAIGSIGGGNGGMGFAIGSGPGIGGDGGDGNVTIHGGIVSVDQGVIGGGAGGFGQDSDIGDDDGGVDFGEDGDAGSGTIVLNWTNTTDRISAYGYYGTVSVTAGKAFFYTNDDKPVLVYGGSVGDIIGGKTLLPCTKDEIQQRFLGGNDADGSAEHPYIISTADGWTVFRIAMEGDAFNGKYFKQGANITFDMSIENNFTPVKVFNGHYDGAGFVISGVNIKNQGKEAGDDGALFLNVESGSSIKNVILRNSTIEGSSAGAIAVNLLGTASLDNCHVLKDVEVRSNYYSAGGVISSISSGTPTISNCSSQATVIANQANAGGVAGNVHAGEISNCLFLGNSLTHGNGYHSNAVTYNSGGTVKNCYFTAQTLSDENAKLMPNKNEDNTDFLNLLHQRDEYLLKAGLAKEQICYDLTINGREYKATQQADGTWKSMAGTVSLPFDMDLNKLENAEDIKVYRLHEVDVDNKVFQFTNEFPILKAGEPYVVVVEKGSLTFTGKDVLVTPTPKEKIAVNNADASKQMGWWCGTFKKLTNEDLVELKAYVIQKNGTFERFEKIFDNHPYVAPFHAYFSPVEPTMGPVYQMKFIRTENGAEAGDVTDFPADEFDFDFDLDNETGIKAIENGKLTIDNEGIYDLQGRKLSGKPNKGIYIYKGKKIIR